MRFLHCSQRHSVTAAMAVLLAMGVTSSAQLTFEQQQLTLPVPNNPKSVHAIDIDGDGDMDYLVGSSVDTAVRVYLNDGGTPITWTPQFISTGAGGVQSVYPVDIDNDGDVDVLVGSGTDDPVSIF